MNKKQKGSSSIGVLTFTILLTVLLFFLMRFIDKKENPERYSEEYNFKPRYLNGNKLTTEIHFLRWYDDSETTSYYIFTNSGRIKINANSNKYGFFLSNENMYNQLEAEIDRFNESDVINCTFQMKKGFFSWKATDYSDCVKVNLY